MKNLMYIIFAVMTLIFTSCGSYESSITSATGANITEYKHIIFGTSPITGSGELNDVSLKVINALSAKLQTVTSEEALTIINNGGKVASPYINVKSEKWDGGHTYITITFYDYKTSQIIAVMKSSGIGMSISEDQYLALKAIIKELDKTFK